MSRGMLRDPARALRLLLVDDHEGDLLRLRALLRGVGGREWSIDWTGSRAEALATVATEPAHDAYLIDRVLGDGDGIALARELAAYGLLGPRLIISHHRDPQAEREAVRAGVAGFLDKAGLDGPRLVRAIDRAIAAGSSRRPPRILVVEDEEALRELWREALGDVRWHVEAVADGRAALAAHAREPFDVVLTDLRLPGLHGTEVAARLRALPPPPALVAISGDALAARSRALFDAVLPKPVALEVLRRTVGALAGAARPIA